jgi:hypothetical protein
MATLQKIIADKFIAKLADNRDADIEKIDQLRVLLTSGKKPKAEDFVKIFTASADGEVK